MPSNLPLRVSAILVVHDGATWLPEVVASITSQSRAADQIIAIDTGSTDSSLKLLQAGGIEVLSMDRTSGFGSAINFALANLPKIDDGAQEWLWLLHDDCALQAGALAELLEAVEARPAVAMAGPKLLGWHDRTHLLELGVSITANGLRWTGMEAHEYDQGQHDGIREVLSVSSAGALIRRDIFEELGGFDLNLELFRDDIDLGWRVRVAGHLVIAVSSAVAFHAQAAATERRVIDVKGAFLHRPLLLDRRNAAYVLLVNSSFMLLPWLVIQLSISALVRALGYLFAKLPGYASDEILAISAMFLHPAELIAARKVRRSHRLISARVVSTFIPSRSSQMRTAASRTIEAIRARLLPDVAPVPTESVLGMRDSEDEDLLTPVTQSSWGSLFRKPLVVAVLGLSLVTLVWARYRFGSLSGGALPASPAGAADLWRAYFSAWHEIGMGSSLATPPWVAEVALASTIFFGKIPFLLTAFFLTAPLIIFAAGYALIRKLSANKWLTVATACLYAISPVSIVAINSGRIGTLVLLILIPYLVLAVAKWAQVETVLWRNIFAVSLLITLIFSFAPAIYIALIALVGYAIVRDLRLRGKTLPEDIFRARLLRQVAIVVIPLLLTVPWSLELLRRPMRFLLEPGFVIAGGGPNLAILANPGGVGALPWWIISPISVVLVIALFSTTQARRIAEFGIVFLLGSTFLSALVVTGNGDTFKSGAFVGSLTACATLASLCAGTVMLDKIRARLQSTHVNYRHYSVGLLVVVTFLYSVSSIVWVVTVGANSPVNNARVSVLPAYLAAETNAKTLIVRQVQSNGASHQSFYIARGSDVLLGQPDVAPVQTIAITKAVQNLVEGNGLTSSLTLSAYGIKYIFLKTPASADVTRIIDGLGGFTRASATAEGIVWRVSGIAGEILFTDEKGRTTALVMELESGNIIVPDSGILTLSESYSRAWNLMQAGVRLERSKNADGLPVFRVPLQGEVTLVHDGTIRRGWISLQVIALVTVLLLALPAGRRKREISEKELA